MALRHKLLDRTEPLLDPDERAEQVFLAQAGLPPWLMFAVILGLGAAVVLWMTRPLIVVITDRSIVVFRAGRIRPARPKDIVARLPRQTRLSPGSGRLWARLDLAGQRVWVSRRFFPDLRASDLPLLAPPTTPSLSAPVDTPPSVPVVTTTGPAPQTAAWPLESGKSRVAKYVVAGFAGLFTVFAVVGVVLNNQESSAKGRLEAYANGSTAYSFVAADGQFRAAFPGPPQRHQERQTIAGQAIEEVTYERDVGADVAFLVTFSDLPVAPADTIAALNGAANGVAVALNGQLLTSRPTMVAGHPAVEFVIDSRLKAGTRSVHYGKLVVVLYGARIYSVGVIGIDNPPAGYDKFFASFAVTR